MQGTKALAIFLAGVGLLTLPVEAQTAKVAPKAPATTAQPQAPVLEPEALDALKRVQAFLRTLKAFELTAEITTEEVYNSGQKIMFGQRLRYRIQRPDQLRLDFQSDLMVRRIFFNGKQTTVLQPSLGYFAQFDKAGSIKDLFVAAENNYGIELPLADMFLWGDPTYEFEVPTSGFLVSTGTVGTERTSHYAFRKPGIDFQIWILEGDTPLPVRMVMTDTIDPAQPQYVANLRWNVKPSLKPEDFTFTPGPGDTKIPIRPPLQAAAAASAKE